MTKRKAASSASPTRIKNLEIRGAGVDGVRKAVVLDHIDRAFGHWSSLLTRIVVREADVNGPRGGVDRRCSIDINPVSLSPVHYEAKAAQRDAALAAAVKGMERLLRRLFERHAFKAGRHGVSIPPKPMLERAESLVGRREGRSALRRELARARPEKKVRDLWVDTAQPGVSETDRRSGSGHTARRNTRKQRDSMTVALEDSLTKPSRKSTRRSANRSKSSQGKERTAVARAVSPSARSRRR